MNPPAFVIGAIIDNTGIASLVAQGVRSIVAMVSASKSFYPPPPPALAAAGKAMEVGRAARLQARGHSLASVAAAELAVVQQIQEHLGPYLEGLYHPQGKAPLDSSLVSLFESRVFQRILPHLSVCVGS